MLAVIDSTKFWIGDAFSVLMVVLLCGILKLWRTGSITAVLLLIALALEYHFNAGGNFR